MLPTLHERGDVVVVDRVSHTLGLRPVRRGDIVIADNPLTTGLRDRVCKRVVAVAGDVVTPRGWGARVVVPAGHVWVEGDNGCNSVDSRYYGPVASELLQGRVVARVWPPWGAAVLTGERRHGATTTAVARAAAGSSGDVSAVAALPVPLASAVSGSLAGVAAMEGVVGEARGAHSGVAQPAPLQQRERPDGYGAGRGGGVPHWLHLPPRFVVPIPAPAPLAGWDGRGGRSGDTGDDVGGGGDSSGGGDVLSRALATAKLLTA
jgi:mitochondrial inner membrane protease subunit 1